MGKSSYFSIRTKSLRSKLSQLKKKIGNILKLDLPKTNTKIEEHTIKEVDRNISIKAPISPNHTIMNSLERPYSTLPVIADKEVLIDSSESRDGSNHSEQESSIPSGSRVLSISLIKGQVIEKVYLTPSGERISLKGNQL